MLRALFGVSLAALLAGCASLPIDRATPEKAAVAKTAKAQRANPSAPKAAAPVAKPAEKKEQPAKKHWYDRFLGKSAQ